MNEQKQINWTALLVRVLLFAIPLIFAGVRWARGVAYYEGALLEINLGLSGLATVIAQNLVVLLELIVAFVLLLRPFGKSVLIWSSILEVIYLVTFLLGLKNIAFGGFDLTGLGVPMLGIILSLIWWGTIFYLCQRKKVSNRLLKWGWSALFSVVIFVLYVVLGPLNLLDFKLLDEPYFDQYANWKPYHQQLEEKYPDFDRKGSYLLVFFNTGCDHCNDAAKKMGVYKRLARKEQKVMAVFFAKKDSEDFWVDDHDIQEFLDRNHLQVPYVKLYDYEAVSIAGVAFPTFIEMKEDKALTYFSGSAFNTKAFDQYFW